MRPHIAQAAPDVKRVVYAYRRQLERQGRTRRTACCYSADVRWFVEWLGADRTITPERVSAYLRSIGFDQGSPIRRRRIRSALKHFIAWAKGQN